MHHINPDKSLVQQPLRLEKPDPSVKVEMPYIWLKQLGMLVADDILKLSEEVKSNFLAKLEDKAGVNSTYTLKAQLHESLIVIFVKLASSKTSPDVKMALALKLAEGIHNCTPGFHDRINEAVASLSHPENIDELLSAQRQAIVSNAAGQESKGEVHAHNRFFVLARNLGYGVRPINAKDVYQGEISDEKIKTKLVEAFSAHYTVFQILNALQEQLASLVRGKGYAGKKEVGYTEEIYREFNDEFLKAFINLKDDDLFLCEDNADGITWRIVDIDWVNVKSALLKKMREENYFIFTPQEEALLNEMASDTASLQLSSESLSLFSTPNELVQSLGFFKEWPIDKKVELVSCYLKMKPEQDQQAVLDKLEKTPELYRELQSSPMLEAMFLSKAVKDNRLDRVEGLVRRGANINPFLVALVEKRKNVVMHWLASDANFRAAINQEGMNVIAEIMVRSPKGRRVLLADKRLQAMCPQIIAGKPAAKWIKLAQKEKNSFIRHGLFALANPEVMAFLQHIVYGEQAEAEAMLIEHQNNPQMLAKLLTAEATVTDYSRRKIRGTGLRMALGAVDVAYQKDEECMVEMLQKWMRKLPQGEGLMAAQIAEQFPAGYEEQEQKRIDADEAALIKVLDAIGRSETDAECEPALQEFDNYLKAKGVIKTGTHFNEKLQEKAYELYDARYDEFGGRWDSRKNILAWRRVNGRIQRNYTACLAQAASRGLDYIVNKGEKLQRTLELRNGPGARFYPLDLNAAFRLGVDYAIAAGWRMGECAVLGAPGGSGGVFSKLCRAKNTIVGATYAAARESSRRQGLRNNGVGD